MGQRFKQFQAAFQEDACLETIMQTRQGGMTLACSACGKTSAFAPRVKLRAYACPHCNFLVSPCKGTPLESRRISLQLWFFALKALTEQGPRSAATTLEREADVPAQQARRMVAELQEAASRDGRAPDWLLAAQKAATGGASVTNVAAGVPFAAADSGSRLRLFSLIAGGALVLAIAGGIAFATLRPGSTEVSGGFEPIESVEAPSLKAPTRPSLILSSVEGDLEAARQATQFALNADPSLAAIKEQIAAETPNQPALPIPVMPPSNVILVPPTASGRPGPPIAAPRSQLPQAPVNYAGDPNQVLTFGPIKIRRHLVEMIVRAGRVVGADPTLLMAVADKESSFSTAVQAKTSSATGLYQFIEQTWLGVIFEFGRKHGMVAEAALITRNGRQFVIADANERQRILDLRREPYLSALLAGEMLKRDTLRLEKAMGRHLTGGEIYLIHFLGPDAAQTFIETMEETPGASAAALLPKPAEANRPIFYAQAGGETKTLSVSEVHKKFDEMIKVRLDRYKVVRGGPAAPPAPARQPQK